MTVIFVEMTVNVTKVTLIWFLLAGIFVLVTAKKRQVTVTEIYMTVMFARMTVI